MWDGALNRVTHVVVLVHLVLQHRRRGAAGRLRPVLQHLREPLRSFLRG